MPAIYDDELLYSVAARYGFMTGYPDTACVNLDLFGDVSGHAIARMPTALAALAERLPSSLGLTGRDLVERHTLLPYYYAYFPADRQDAAVGEALAVNGRPDKAAGIDAKPLSPPRRLRFCPACHDHARCRT